MARFNGRGQDGNDGVNGVAGADGSQAIWTAPAGPGAQSGTCDWKGSRDQAPLPAGVGAAGAIGSPGGHGSIGSGGTAGGSGVDLTEDVGTSTGTVTLNFRGG